MRLLLRAWCFLVFAFGQAEAQSKVRAAPPPARGAAAAAPAQSLILPRSAIVSLRPTQAAPPRVGVYGGTFDPMHVGHIEIMERAQDAFGLDQMVVFPNFKPEGKEDALSFDERWEMLRGLTAGRDDLILPPKSVLRRLLDHPDGRQRLLGWLRERYPEQTSFYRVMGADSFQKLLEFSKTNGVLDQPDRPDVIVVERAGAAKPDLKGLKGVHWLPLPRGQPFSSTLFRSDPLLREAMLAEPVARAVKEKGLYRRGGERGFYDLPPHVVSWLIWEQALNDRHEDLKAFPDSIQTDNGLKPRYLPERRPTFWIETVELPVEKARILQTGPIPEGIIIEREGRRLVRFFIHPESKAFFRKRLKGAKFRKEFLATPTSSHRSLVVWNPRTQDPPLSVKVSLDVDIGGMRRLVTRGQLERAAAVSALLKTIPAGELARLKARFLDEPAGIHLQGFDYGFGVRALPQELDPGVELVPMFSLYAKPTRGPPPVVNLARRSGLAARDFVRRAFIEPLARQAVALAFGHGLVGEPHEQNVLMELKDGRPTGAFWYRDLSGHHVNPRLRRAAGKDMSFLPEGISDRSLRVERADLIDNLRSYLGRSNFFALRAALEPFFPEVSSSWINKTLRETLAAKIEERTGLPSRDYREMARAISSYLKKSEGAR